MPDDRFPNRTMRTGRAGKHSDARTASPPWAPKARRRKPPGYSSWKRRIAAATSAGDGRHRKSVEIDHGRDADEEPGGAAKDAERNARVDGILRDPMNERIAGNRGRQGEDGESDETQNRLFAKPRTAITSPPMERSAAPIAASPDSMTPAPAQ